MDGGAKGTPCEVVIQKGEVLFIADEVAGEFPDDPDLEKLGMTSYIGIPFKDNSRKVFGHLAVMDRRPVHDKEAALSMMRIFASRAGAELRRIRAEERLRQRKEKLSRLLDTAPDAIVELDPSMNIQRGRYHRHQPAPDAGSQGRGPGGRHGRHRACRR